MSGALRQEGQVTMVGFQDFWTSAYESKKVAFQAITDLFPVQEELFKKSVSEPLHKVVRRIAKIGYNSLGALTTLLLNGYGNDGMKIARNLFEGAVTTAYLRAHPAEIDDYLDFYHILTKRQLDYLDERDPDRVKALKPERRAEIEREYAGVAPRFITKKGYPRNHWCQKSLFKMAQEVGREDHYRTFYASASGMHHIDISGVAAQSEEESFDVDVAPSMNWLDIALITGHGATIEMMVDYDAVAGHGMDGQLKKVQDDFEKAWKV